MFFFLFFLRQIVRISSRFVDFCRSLDTDVARFFKEIFSNRCEYAKELFIVRKFFTGSNGKKLLLSSFLVVDTDLQFLRFFFFLFTRIAVLSDLKKKKEIIPLKKNRKRREKKNILRDKRLPEFVYFLLYHVFIEGWDHYAGSPPSLPPRSPCNVLHRHLFGQHPLAPCLPSSPVCFSPLRATVILLN